MYLAFAVFSERVIFPMQKGKYSYHQKSPFFTIILLALSPLLGMGIDLLAPSLPSIVKDLHASDTAVKCLISLYLLGYAIGTVIVGFLSDSWGRRKLLLVGLFLFSITSLLPLYFSTIPVLLTIRFLQGFFIASLGLSRPIFVDVFHSDKLVHTLSWLASVWSMGALLGPFIGGYLTEHYSWRACFVFFSAFGFTGLFSLLFLLPETLAKKTPFSFQTIKTSLIEILSHRIFIGTVLIIAATYSTLLLFNTLGPFLIQIVLEKSSLFFGYIALVLGAGFFCGTLFSRALLKLFLLDKILYTILKIILAIAFSFFISTLLLGSQLSLIMGHALALFFGIGIIYPLASIKSAMLFQRLAGSATSLIVFINLSINSIATALFSIIPIHSALPLASLFAVLLAIALLCFKFLVYAPDKA